MASTATTEKTADRQRALADALAKIDAAFPPRRDRAAEFFARAIARGEPVLIGTPERAVKFNGGAA